MDTKLREIKKEAQPLHDAASKVKRELGKLGQQHKLVQKHELRMKELEAAWEKCGSFNVPGMLKIKKQKEIETQEWEAIKGRVMQGTEPDRQQLEREIARLLQEQKTIEHTLENVVVRATPYEEKKSVLEKERGTASKELDSIERDERRAKQKLLGEDHEHGRGR